MVKRFSQTERQIIFHFLLEKSVHGKLKRGFILEASHQFSCSTSTIKRIWSQVKNTYSKGLLVDVSSNLKSRVGRKKSNLIEMRFHKFFYDVEQIYDL